MTPPGPGRFGLLDGFGRQRRSRPPSASPDIPPQSWHDRRASGKCSTKAGWLPRLAGPPSWSVPILHRRSLLLRENLGQSQNTSIADLIADQVNKAILVDTVKVGAQVGV